MESLVSMVGATREAVSRALCTGHFPLVVGGDDPPLLGCLQAAREVYGRVGLLFVDGHEDAYPTHDSPTGEAADTELGLALGGGSEGLPRELRETLPLLDPLDAALLGPRDESRLVARERLARVLDGEALLGEPQGGFSPGERLLAVHAPSAPSRRRGGTKSRGSSTR